MNNLNIKYIYRFIFISLLLIFYSCEIKKPEIPTGVSNKNIRIQIVDTKIEDIDLTGARAVSTVNSLEGFIIDEHGHCWSTEPKPDINSITKSQLGQLQEDGSFSTNITELEPGQKYYVRAYVQIIDDTIIYSEQVIFTTNALVQPVIETGLISNITASGVTCGGTLISYGGHSIDSRGVCISREPEPTIENGIVINAEDIDTFSFKIQNLLPFVDYYIRAFVTFGEEVVYGQVEHFKTKKGTVTDIDGNTYSTLTIGDQVWMGENLKTTRYANGTSLVDGTGVGDIATNFSTKYWFVYSDNNSYKNTYGLLYTWAAVMNGASGSTSVPSGVRGICPTGWHVPSNDEWAILGEYLGGLGNAGKALKESGLTHWSSPNEGATNSSSFTALPGGDRNPYNSSFEGVNYGGYWWTATEHVNSGAIRAGLHWNATDLELLGNDNDQSFGFSVRCISD